MQITLNKTQLRAKVACAIHKNKTSKIANSTSHNHESYELQEQGNLRFQALIFRTRSMK